MNIEEVINILKKYISFSEKECNFPSIWDWNWHMELANDIENLLTAYEKEKEKNKELSNSYDKLAKECNEENRRCMLLAVENQDLKEKNKELNILRLELLISQFPDTTETYKKYKKELDELLKEE